MEFLPDALLNWTKQNSDAKLCAVFSPEHGLLGNHEAAASVEGGFADQWGCPVYSLHGSTRTPTSEMLSGLDLLIVDFQEVGLRCYTYLSTLKLVMQSAKENDVDVMVLDRPNPIQFWGVRGPGLKPEFESFVGKVNVPFIHGTTIGRIAHQINNDVGAKLIVLSCAKSLDLDDHFFYDFIPPSPNLNSIDAVYAYPLTVLIEGTNYSEGRGTAYPFRQIGAPWVDGVVLAERLNSKAMPGVFFEPVTFTPKIISGVAENPKHKNVECKGVFVHIFNRRAANPITVGQTILKELFTMYSAQSGLEKWGGQYATDLLTGNDQLRKWLLEIRDRVSAKK